MSSADFILACVTRLIRLSSMCGLLAPLFLFQAFTKVLSFIHFFLWALTLDHLTHSPDFRKAAVYPFYDLYPPPDHSPDLSLEHEAYCSRQEQTHHSLMLTPGLSSPTPRHPLSPGPPWSPSPRSLNTTGSSSDLTLTSAPPTSFPSSLPTSTSPP